MVNGEFPLLLGKGKQIKGSLLINELCISHCLMEQKQRKMQTSGIFWNNIKKYFEAVKHFQARSGKIYELVDLLQRHTFLRLQLLLLERKKNVFCFCWLNWSQNNSSVSWTSKHFFQDPLTLRLAKCTSNQTAARGNIIMCPLSSCSEQRRTSPIWQSFFSVLTAQQYTTVTHNQLVKQGWDFTGVATLSSQQGKSPRPWISAQSLASWDLAPWLQRVSGRRHNRKSDEAEIE